MSDIAARARYEQFAELHRGPDPFIMPNAWDGPSALLFKEAGFKSIATSQRLSRRHWVGSTASTPSAVTRTLTMPPY